MMSRFRSVPSSGPFFSYQTLTDRTGLSKSAVQRAVALLVRRQLVRVRRKSATAVPEYVVLTPWVRE
jgi:DNA-binding MarR family transcriptional regulator